MADKRIYQIAKELNISHNEIIKFLENKDIKVSNHMMPVENSIYSIILMEFSKEKKQVERILKEKARQTILTTKKTIEEEKIREAPVVKEIKKVIPDIISTKDFFEKTDEELLALKGIGEKSLEKIKDLLSNEVKNNNG